MLFKFHRNNFLFDIIIEFFSLTIYNPIHCRLKAGRKLRGKRQEPGAYPRIQIFDEQTDLTFLCFDSVEITLRIIQGRLLGEYLRHGLSTAMEEKMLISLNSTIESENLKFDSTSHAFYLIT